VLRGVKLPVEYETRHMLILGKTGMGKTTLISHQLQTLRDEKVKVIIYDYKGDMVRKFYDPERGDKIFNPLDKRTVKWNIFREIQSEPDILSLATSLIPPAFSNDKYFHDGARTVFASVLKSLLADNRATNKDIWDVLSMPHNDIYTYLQKHNQYSALQFIPLDAKPQAAGILSTLIEYTQIFEKLALIDGDFSLHGWLTNEEEKGWLFVVGYENLDAL
jgi:type IV secretory pathway TraG/TraD family ATPase VirD4